MRSGTDVGRKDLSSSKRSSPLLKYLQAKAFTHYRLDEVKGCLVTANLVI